MSVGYYEFYNLIYCLGSRRTSCPDFIHLRQACGIFRGDCDEYRCICYRVDIIRSVGHDRDLGGTDSLFTGVVNMDQVGKAVGVFLVILFIYWVYLNNGL